MIYMDVNTKNQLDKMLVDAYQAVENENYDLALSYFNTILNHVEIPSMLVDKGHVLIELGLYDEAISVLNRAISIMGPNDPIDMAWHNKGRAYLALDDYMQAEPCFDKAIQFNIHNTDAMDGKVICLINHTLENINSGMNGGHVSEALDLCNQLLNTPEFKKFLPIFEAKILVHKGFCLVKLERYEEALEVNNQALFLMEPTDPYFADVVANNGFICYEKNEFDAALACYQRAESLKPGSSHGMLEHVLSAIKEANNF